jgi:hypothetical protein
MTLLGSTILPPPAMKACANATGDWIFWLDAP